jgi:hypothetical protein
MNEHDAGIVGKRLANAVIVAAILLGSAAIVAAISMYF